MAHTSCTELSSPQQRLLQLAVQALHARLLPTRPSAPIPIDDLQAMRATFVTLNQHGQLRGCMGCLSAVRPLAEDVRYNADLAAFHDPRFTAVHATELPTLSVHIAILGAMTTMTFCSEADLLQQLQPGEDGLILEYGTHRGTFLPSVWASLPAPDVFLARLKQKAGLPQNFWSPALKISRYPTESFGASYQDICYTFESFILE